MQHLLRVLCVLLVISVSAPRTWAEEVIDTVTDAAQRSTLAQAAQTLLSGITPQQGKGTTEGTSQIKDGHFLLWGELFEPGRTVAVVELGKHIALADWDAQKAIWTVTQVIKVPVYWLHPGATEVERDMAPDDLPTKPFRVKQLAPSVPRLLVVSTDHSRYHAGRFVFAYDAKVHALDVDGALFSVDEPVLREGYVVATNDSGRKAWWAEENYYQVENGHLKFRGSLREGSYRGEDLHLHVGFTNPGSSEETTWRFNATPDDQSSFKIQAGDEGPDEEKDPVIGHIRFRKGSTGDQAAFLLHKLTDLPATLVNPNLFSGGDAPQVQMPNLTDRDVEVTGNAEVLRLLGPASATKPGKGK